jgi:ribosomal protein L10
MKKRSEKQQDLDKLKTDLAKVSTVILSTFQGITVEEDTKLRRAVQAAGGKYKVVKNTLAERAGAERGEAVGAIAGQRSRVGRQEGTHGRAGGEVPGAEPKVSGMITLS